MARTKFLNFDQAVKLSELLVAYFNTAKGREALEKLGSDFGLTVKQNYHVEVSRYEMNCPGCSGCDEKGCILGCFVTPSNHVCYWDQALEKIIGTKLVTHEIAHVIFEQAYDTKGMNDNEFFKTSEKFAQFVERRFTENLVWCAECKQFEVLLDSNFESSNASVEPIHIVNGFLWGIGFVAAGALFTYAITRKKDSNFESKTLDS